MPRNGTELIEKVSRESLSQHKAAELLGEALKELGMDYDSNPSTEHTPVRFVKYLQEFFQPFSIQNIIGDGFEAVHDNTSIQGMVVQSHIPFTAICEHHLLPFQGEAFLGYIPNMRIVGLSKLTRLVYAVGHERPGIQEAITERIAEALFKGIHSKGSIVVIRAHHACMGCRGVNTPEAVTTTSCIRGVFRDVLSAKEEFLSLAGLL